MKLNFDSFKNYIQLNKLKFIFLLKTKNYEKKEEVLIIGKSVGRVYLVSNFCKLLTVSRNYL